MRVRVIHTIDDLADDMRAIAARARPDMRGVVRQGLRTGNTVAKDDAKRTARRHGKHYPNAFSWEMHTSLFGPGSAVISGEYGPDVNKRQGGMSFENGSRNQKPHRNLAKSADLIGPAFANEAAGLYDEWFWP